MKPRSRLLRSFSCGECVSLVRRNMKSFCETFLCWEHSPTYVQRVRTFHYQPAHSSLFLNEALVVSTDRVTSIQGIPSVVSCHSDRIYMWSRSTSRPTLLIFKCHRATRSAPLPLLRTQFFARNPGAVLAVVTMTVNLDGLFLGVLHSHRPSRRFI